MVERQQSQSVSWGGFEPSGVATSVRVGPIDIPLDAKASDKKVDRSWRRWDCCSLYCCSTALDSEVLPVAVAATDAPPLGRNRGDTDFEEPWIDSIAGNRIRNNDDHDLMTFMMIIDY
jgi:hypothetical protein